MVQIMSTRSNAFALNFVYTVPINNNKFKEEVKMKKKLISALLVAAMTASMLTGCGGSTPTTTSTGTGETTEVAKDSTTEAAAGDEAAATKNPVTLKTVSMFGATDPNKIAYDAINEEFKKSHDYITLEDNSAVADNEWKASVVADFSVGNEPDVLQYFTDAMADTIVATDKLVTYDEIVAEYPDYGKDTIPEVLDFAKNTDGVKRALPTTGFMEVMYCNKDLFDQYKLELPTDWDSMVTAIKTFKENGVIPVAVSLNNIPHYWIENLILSSSGMESYTSVPETAPAEWVKGLELFKELRDMGAFPEDTDTVDDPYVGELFKSKKAAMQVDGTWYAGGIKDTENTVAIPFPGVPEQVAPKGSMPAGFSSGFYITRKAWEDPDKRAAAVEYVMAHASKEGVTQYWDVCGRVNKTATEVVAEGELTPLAQSIVECGKAAGANFNSAIDSRMDAEAFTNIVNSIVSISTGKAQAEDVINDALALHHSRKK